MNHRQSETRIPMIIGTPHQEDEQEENVYGGNNQIHSLPRIVPRKKRRVDEDFITTPSFSSCRIISMNRDDYIPPLVPDDFDIENDNHQNYNDDDDTIPRISLKPRFFSSKKRQCYEHHVATRAYTPMATPRRRLDFCDGNDEVDNGRYTYTTLLETPTFTATTLRPPATNRILDISDRFELFVPRRMVPPLPRGGFRNQSLFLPRL